jgi:predicted RNA-binding protein with PUA-like domain
MERIPMNYWLMKTEPDVFSIDDLDKMKRAPWDGVRNYQARNNMRSMKKGDMVLFYHSSTEPAGVAGLARVSRESFPDDTAWDSKSDTFDPRSTKARPVWFMVEVEFQEKFPHFVSLEEMKADPRLQAMMVTRRGMRLSVQPVEKEHAEIVVGLGRKEKVAG